jgi:REP element-mobilizing transposase RayT
MPSREALSMGRLPRPVDEGLIYHALNRGDNRADVFTDDADHEAFRESLAKTQERYPFRLFGYCATKMVSDHFFRCVEDGEPRSSEHGTTSSARR